MILKCLVIDDEPLAREGIADYAKQVDFLEVKGVCADALEANRAMQQHSIDLLFLDIQMPRLNGIDWLKSIKRSPAVIFTTAHQKFAIESFQFDVIDYLLKPITFERFFRAANKAMEYFQIRNRVSTTDPVADFIFVKSEGRLEKIMLEEINFIEAQQNYVMISTTQSKIITHTSMKFLEEMLAPKRFLRVHKSYFVATSKIQYIEGNMLVIGENKIPISRDKKEMILQQITQNRLIG